MLDSRDGKRSDWIQNYSPYPGVEVYECRIIRWCWYDTPRKRWPLVFSSWSTKIGIADKDVRWLRPRSNPKKNSRLILWRRSWSFSVRLDPANRLGIRSLFIHTILGKIGRRKISGSASALILKNRDWFYIDTKACHCQEKGLDGWRGSGNEKMRAKIGEQRASGAFSSCYDQRRVRKDRCNGAYGGQTGLQCWFQSCLYCRQRQYIVHERTIWWGISSFQFRYNGLKPDPGYTGYDNVCRTFWVPERKIKTGCFCGLQTSRFLLQSLQRIKCLCQWTARSLLTLWHFPGAVATTPTLTRIPSKNQKLRPICLYNLWNACAAITFAFSCRRLLFVGFWRYTNERQHFPCLVLSSRTAWRYTDLSPKIYKSETSLVNYLDVPHQSWRLFAGEQTGGGRLPISAGRFRRMMLFLVWWTHFWFGAGASDIARRCHDQTNGRIVVFKNFRHFLSAFFWKKPPEKRVIFPRYIFFPGWCDFNRSSQWL